MDLAVVGAGYVGAVTAACLAGRGHRVTILESNAAKAAALQRGSVAFFEPGLAELVAEGVGAERLHATTDASAVEGAEAVLVCVGTPLGGAGGADLSQVRSACDLIARHAPAAVVVMRSTLPLGESENLAGWLGRDSLDRVVTNPEFLRQGSAVADFLQPTRIVFGTDTGAETAGSLTARAIYDDIDAPVVVTGYASAEMIKNAANAYLAMKLSFINEIADLCEVYGADVDDVVEGIGLDPRIGGSYLRPGIGFGGSCLPKELANMLALGRRRGLPMHTFDAASRSNDERAKRVANRLEGLLGPLQGKRVAMLGLAFKANTDDTRYSPAIALARELMARGASVVAHDPKVPAEVSAAIGGLARVDTAETAVDGASLVVISTEWPEYRDLDWAHLATRAADAVLFDGRNALDRTALAGAGWRVIRVGSAPVAS